jgi:hypothetical protein
MTLGNVFIFLTVDEETGCKMTRRGVSATDDLERWTMNCKEIYLIDRMLKEFQHNSRVSSYVLSSRTRS